LKASDSRGNIYDIEEDQGLKRKLIASSKDSFLVIFKLFEDPRGKLWLLSNKGLFHIEGQFVEPYLIEGKQLISIPLFSAAEDNNGQIWFASYQGVFRLKDKVLSYFNQSNGLTNNIIYDVLSDKEGNIWMGSDGEGVFRYSGGPFISFDENFGLPNKQVTSISGNEFGEVFFVSYQGKLSSYSLGGQIKIINTNVIHNDIITALQYQRKVGLWIGTRTNGLYLLKNSGQLHKVLNNNWPIKLTTITNLFLDTHNKLWIGLPENVCWIQGSLCQQISLNDATPICMEQIGQDSILIGTNSGFYLVKNNSSETWRPFPLLDSVVAQDMVRRFNEVYIGTTERGIIAYDFIDKKSKIYNSRNGISSDFIYNILLDTIGNIWAGTGMGICKLEVNKEGNPAITVYGKANGIIGLESNSSASFMDEQGHIWFGTTEGVSCYFPTANPTISKPVKIVLESVKLFGGKSIDSTFYSGSTYWYNIPKELELPFRLNSLSFAFQAITLSPFDKILYRYVLENATKDWSEWTEENTINFSALEPGNYTLKVMCKVNGRIQNEATFNYSFKIKTPFHKSIWFVISIIAIAIFCGVGLQYAANRKKLNRQKREDQLRKEEQSRIRERTAEDFHDEVGNKLTRINVLTTVLKSKIENSNQDIDRVIQQIQDNSLQLYAGTRDILWSLQPSNDNLFEVLNHIADLARELFSDIEINFVFTGNLEVFKDYKMPLDKSRNFIMIWKEALNNCLKYSTAKNVLFQIQILSDKSIQIRLVDDGIGFDKEQALGGHGLKNMNTRAKRLDALFDIKSIIGKGTHIILTLSPTKQI
jgi:signal transduction histidine kinase